MKKDKYDCIIIGAGLSGIAAGIRLTHFGKKVCICEQHTLPGGLNSYYYRKGILIETGLHAMTNFAEKKDGKSLPLKKLTRQLRIPLEDLHLREQNCSLIKFPYATLKFTNNFDDLLESVRDNFPHEIDNFILLDKFIEQYDALNLNSKYVSARETVSRYIRDQRLSEMLFCPLMYYGSAVEDDMDMSQFVIMYKSIFKEGFCRPGKEGIKTLLELLESRFTDAGGTIKYNAKIEKIVVHNGAVKEIVLQNGSALKSDNVLSCAGLPETLNLLQYDKDNCCNTDTEPEFLSHHIEGKLGFIELVTLTHIKHIKHLDFTIMFFNSQEKFSYKNPGKPYNPDSGVICLPGNFKFKPEDKKNAPMIRITALADYNSWATLPKEKYKLTKKTVTSECLKSTEQLINIKNLNEKIFFSDLITPCTIQRYTGRINGAVYGSPYKQKNGKTHIENLFICGTDQGFLGIAGAMLSGISIANLYLLK